MKAIIGLQNGLEKGEKSGIFKWIWSGNPAVDLTCNFFVLCRNVKFYLNNYS